MGTIETLPGGIRILSGGTRSSIKLSRPWQKSFAELGFINVETCPFEPGALGDRPRSIFPDTPGWLALWNSFTPWPYHRLIIPEFCFGEEKLQRLGGAGEIFSALRIACSIMDERPDEAWDLGVHVGPYAGQNLGHFHWHLVGHGPDAWAGDTTLHLTAIMDEARRSPLVVAETSMLRVVAGGVLAGECLFVPKFVGVQFESYLGDLASIIETVVDLGNQKWRSTEGLPPNFVLSLGIEGRFLEYGSYIPKLNHGGFPEYNGMLFRTSPFTLPWPHKVTHQYLTS